MLDVCFEGRFCRTVTGGAEVSAAETARPYDMIFFTGSTAVGRKVMAAAAQNLTPVVLELGGKSPCIVDETADLPVAAARIIWGKCLNKMCIRDSSLRGSWVNPPIQQVPRPSAVAASIMKLMACLLYTSRCV